METARNEAPNVGKAIYSQLCLSIMQSDAYRNRVNFDCSGAFYKALLIQLLKTNIDVVKISLKTSNK